MPINRPRSRAAPRGFTLIEMSIALAILGVIFVGVILLMNVIVTGMYSEGVESDQHARVAGRMSDILSEIRQASAQSPNFAVAGSATTPPSITFDLPAGSTSTGTLTWGSKVKYSLAAMPGFIDPEGSVQDAVILRDETQPSGAIITTVIENHVPYKITENGVVYWGFNVSVAANAVTVSIRRSGDTRTNLGTSVQANSSTQNSLATSIYSGTYYLRNPQSAIPAN